MTIAGVAVAMWKDENPRLTPDGRIYQRSVPRETTRQRALTESPRGNAVAHTCELGKFSSADCNNSNHTVGSRPRGGARYGFNRFINLLLSRRMADNFANDRPTVRDSKLVLSPVRFRADLRGNTKNEVERLAKVRERWRSSRKYTYTR